MEDEYDAMMEEDFDEEEVEPLLLAIGVDGKATIKKPSDYVELEKKDVDLIRGFIKENQKLFNEYIKKHDAKSENQEESHQEKCGDTLTHQHRHGTHPEEGQVSKENDMATDDTNLSEKAEVEE